MLHIFFEDRNLTLNAENESINILKVKDVINNLKKALKIEENDKKFMLIEDSKNLNDDEEINLSVSKDGRTLFLVETKNYNSQANRNLKAIPIDELIMKVTGAKDKPNVYRLSTRKKSPFDYGYGASSYESEFYRGVLQSSTNNTGAIGSSRLVSLESMIRQAQREIPNSEVVSSPRMNTTVANNTTGRQPYVSSNNQFYSYARPTAVQPDPELINNLKEMGFEEERIKRVLIATRNDYAAAAEMLLNDTDISLAEDLPNNAYPYRNYAYYGQTGTSNNNAYTNNEGSNLIEREVDNEGEGEGNEWEVNDVVADDELIEMENELIAQIERENNIENNNEENNTENNTENVQNENQDNNA